VPLGIPEKVIFIKGATYEIRYFSFENTSGKIYSDHLFTVMQTKRNCYL